MGQSAGRILWPVKLLSDLPSRDRLDFFHGECRKEQMRKTGLPRQGLSLTQGQSE